MNDKSQMLSICIPTFNRGDYLGKCLDAFINEVANYNISICISDNCSSDNTKDVVETYKRKYANIHYQCNEKNLGFDENVLCAVRMADSDYCWLFGDDDLIEPGVIHRIVEKIEQQYQLIILNTSTVNEDFSIVVEKQHWPFYEDRKYDKHESDLLFRDLVLYTSFIGSLVIKRELWNQVNYLKYMKTGFVHVGIAFEYVRGKKAFFISSSYIKNRLNNSGWAAKSFEIWYCLWPQAINAIPAYCSSLKKSVANPINLFSIKCLLVERAKGTFGVGEYKKFISKEKSLSTMKRMIIFLISVFPHFILKWIYLAYRGKMMSGYERFCLLNKNDSKKYEYIG